MARAGLRWSRANLAHAAGLSVTTVQRFEAGDDVAEHSIDLMARCLEQVGVVLLPGSPSAPGGCGVRLPSWISQAAADRHQPTGEEPRPIAALPLESPRGH